MGFSPDDTPRFSIVMPAYQAQATLARAIDSVLAQTCGDWELIVVDDGSTDGTRSIAEEYVGRDDRVTLVRLPDNTGCAAARGVGAKAATGAFVTKFDADDELEPHALAVLSDAIDAHPKFDIYSATGYKVYPDGSVREALNDPKFLRSLSLTLDDLIDDCWIFGGGATIRRETLERIGGFRPQMHCEDYDLWLRALAGGATQLYIPEHIYRYSMGLAGRMNEYPERSFRSYIEILTDLRERGVFDARRQRLVDASIAKFAERVRQLESTGSTDAEFTDAQARWVKERVYRVFGSRVGDAVILALDKVKWAVKPLRVAIARRRRLKGEKR